MLNRFKTVVNNVMGGVSALPLPELSLKSSAQSDDDDDEATTDDDRANTVKIPYGRPDFLGLNPDEVQVSADHVSRPIIVPRDIGRLPWGVGYAEVINSGKSRFNEDQARAGQFSVGESYENITADEAGSTSNSPGAEEQERNDIDQAHYISDGPTPDGQPMSFTYFAIFDGHAGTGAALMAVQTLHYVVQEKLSNIRELLYQQLSSSEQPGGSEKTQQGFFADKTSQIEVDALVTGALESAFLKMDSIIAQERQFYKISGGCTALVVIFFLGKLYVANAGDSRAVIVRNSQAIPMSHDFTPHTERDRLQYIGYMCPELLQNDFCHLQFVKRVIKKDLGTRVLCKNAAMSGWTLKTIVESDLKYPLVCGEGKRARLLATIGVTRGFGDHDLRVGDSTIYIKPFLTAIPEVRVYEMHSRVHQENDVLIMASDGLWDIISNERAAKIVNDCLMQLEPSHPSRYTSAAQELVMSARGLLQQGWRTPGDKPASGDDITAFVIPLCMYSKEASQCSSTESAGDIS